MADYPFPLAPRNEQKRIVDEIEKQFTRLDAAVANLKRIQANLERYKASVLKAACEGRLVPQEADLNPDYEPADKLLERILEERRRRWEEEAWQKQVERAKKKVEQARRKAAGLPYYFRDMEPEDWMDVPEEEYRDYLPKSDKWKEKYEEPERPDTDDLPELPEGWRFTRIDALLDIARGGMKTGPFGSLLKKHEHRDSGVPVLGIENVGEMRFVSGSKIHITAEKAKELEGYEAVAGDILVTRSGTVGEVCVVPPGLGEARISTNLMRITLNQSGMEPRFFTILFNGSPFVLDQVAELCSGSTRDFLNQRILYEIIFPLPPYAEQLRIVDEAERRLSVIEAFENACEEGLVRADRLRQCILQQAFSGNLVPQDSDDEPALNLINFIHSRSLGDESEQLALL